jgi:hypothetical protein
MFCSYCGVEMPENSYVCLKCGAKVESSFRLGKTVNAGYIIAAAVVFLILGLALGGGGMYLLNRHDNISPEADSLALVNPMSAQNPNAYNAMMQPGQAGMIAPDNNPAQGQDNVYDANLHALAGELQNYASQVIQYWKTPESQGGAGQNYSALNTYGLAMYLGFTDENPAKSLETDNGTFIVDSITNGIVVLKGVGRAKKNGLFPLVTTRVDLSGGSITSQIGQSAGF